MTTHHGTSLYELEICLAGVPAGSVVVNLDYEIDAYDDIQITAVTVPLSQYRRSDDLLKSTDENDRRLACYAAHEAMLCEFWRKKVFEGHDIRWFPPRTILGKSREQALADEYLHMLEAA